MTWRAWVLGSLVLAACGGRSHEAGGPGGAAAGNGGSGATGGASGGSGGTGAVCCNIAASCGADEQQVPSLDACPDGATCREVTACCSTIVCATTAKCMAAPFCDDGDSIVKDGKCAPIQNCYERQACGASITCSDDYCDPATDTGRGYVMTGDCSGVAVDCAAQTRSFVNHCGCGCQQADDCPAFIDCSPGPEPNPQCSEEMLAHCPYSVRAL